MDEIPLEERRVIGELIEFWQTHYAPRDLVTHIDRLFGSSGAIDSLPAIADVCSAENAWLHIDAAHGGAALLSKKGQPLLQGLDKADSLVLDPHKWLFQPYEIGCVLTRQSRWLRETFSVLPEYLKDVAEREEEVNFRDYGIQLTRNTRVLKLWMSLKVFGLAAFRQAVTRGWNWQNSRKSSCSSHHAGRFSPLLS